MPASEYTDKCDRYFSIINMQESQERKFEEKVRKKVSSSIFT